MKSYTEFPHTAWLRALKKIVHPVSGFTFFQEGRAASGVQFMAEKDGICTLSLNPKKPIRPDIGMCWGCPCPSPDNL